MRVEALSPLQRGLIFAGGALLLPVIVILGLLFRDQFIDREAAVQQATLQNVELLVELADARLRSDLQVMLVLASSEPLVSGDFEAARERAAVVLDATPGWTSIALRDSKTGRVLFETGRAPTGMPERSPSPFPRRHRAAASAASNASGRIVPVSGWRCRCFSTRSMC